MALKRRSLAPKPPEGGFSKNKSFRRKLIRANPCPSVDKKKLPHGSPSVQIRVNLWTKKTSARKPETRLIVLKRRSLAPNPPRGALAKTKASVRKPIHANLWITKLPQEALRANQCPSVDEIKASAGSPSVIIRVHLWTKEKLPQGSHPCKSVLICG
jgi:hypothetical protein